MSFLLSVIHAKYTKWQIILTVKEKDMEQETGNHNELQTKMSHDEICCLKIKQNFKIMKECVNLAGVSL